jgi:hypothetical protein
VDRVEPDLPSVVGSGLPEESVAAHTHAWEHYLERLRVAATGGDPGPDPMITD